MSKKRRELFIDLDNDCDWTVMNHRGDTFLDKNDIKTKTVLWDHEILVEIILLAIWIDDWLIGGWTCEVKIE